MFVDAYLPGFKAGGPIVSVSRIIEQDPTNTFQVITRDRDLGESSAYPDVNKKQWKQVGRATVAYLRPGLKDLPWIARQLRQYPPDVYYFNSLQSPWYTLMPLIGIKTRMLPKRNVIIAPRGEASPGALTLKGAKKRLWRPVIKRLIGSRVTWHVSSTLEQEEVIGWWGSSLPDSHSVRVWSDPAVKPRSQVKISHRERAQVIVFASRIDRKKGLLEAIEILAQVQHSFEFRIYGEISDPHYWEECRKMAEGILPGYSWAYFGSYAPKEIEFIFSEARVFLFPTHGENFGHVISEALSVGCPVILPPTTPWTPVIDGGGGMVIRDRVQVIRYIERLLGSSEDELMAFADRAKKAYLDWFNDLAQTNFEELATEDGRS